MRYFDAAVLGILIMGATSASAGDRPAPKGTPLPLTPVFRHSGSGWQFEATYQNTTTKEEDLAALLEKTSIVLDGKTHQRSGGEVRRPLSSASGR